MSILVAGGAGYIGSHVVKKLLDENEEVVVIDNLETGHKEAIDQRAEFYLGDIRDKDFLEYVFSNEDIEAVIHFAANSLVAESMTNPLKYYDNNLGGAIALTQAMDKYGVDKIVFSSTAATYGEPERIPIEETDKTEPTNTYGETKLAMEKLFKWASNASPLRYVSLRYFNACGADDSGKIGEDHSPESHLIPIILQVPLGKRDYVEIYGNDYNTPDGTCIRDYIHVDDLADAHYKALEYLRTGADSEIFNLGSGEGYSVNEVISAAREVTGEKIPARISPRREGDPSVLVASSKKASKILGWKPKKDDIRIILEDAWRWHKNNPDGYGDLN